MPAKLSAVPPFNTLKFKKTLSINPCFYHVSDSRKSPLYSLGDTLMSAATPNQNNVKYLIFNDFYRWSSQLNLVSD